MTKANRIWAVARGGSRARHFAWLSLFSALQILAPGLLTAHPGLDEQIANVTRQINQDPKNVELYVKRARLHRRHDDLDAVREDLATASRLSPALPVIELEWALYFLERGEPKKALDKLDRFLVTNPTHVRARLARAKVLAELDEGLAAARDYTAVIEITSAPLPENYIDRANVLVGAGPTHLAAALRGLDEGITRLGHVTTLEQKAMEIELMLGHHDAALRRLHRLSERSPRKERWLSQRADILVEAGRFDEARRAFETALTSIDALPARHRTTPAMAELRTRIEVELRQLSPGARSEMR